MKSVTTRPWAIIVKSRKLFYSITKNLFCQFAKCLYLCKLLLNNIVLKNNKLNFRNEHFKRKFGRIGPCD